MARYLLVEVDDNDTAAGLHSKLAQLEQSGKGVRVVGLFSKPSRLCECSTRSQSSVRGVRWGWWLCPECRRPKSGGNQTLTNLMDDEGCPAKYRDLMLLVRWVAKAGRVVTVRSLPKEQWK